MARRRSGATGVVRWTVLTLLLACDPDPSSTSGDDDDDVPTSDSAPLPPPPGTTPAPFSDVQWAVDEAYGTLVWVTWTQSEAATVHLEYAARDGERRSTPARALEAGEHEEVLLGVPYGSALTFRLVAEGVSDVVTGDWSARTSPLPDRLEVPRAVSGTGWDPEVPWILLSLTPTGGGFGDRWWAMIVDRAGEVVWARRSDPERMTMHPRLTWDETALLLDQNSFWPGFDHGAASTIRRTTLDGRAEHEFAAPGLHHPFSPMPDGSVVYGSIHPDHNDEDLAQVDVTGARTVLWSCKDWLATLDLDVPQYCTSNTVNYDLRTDTFLFSFYSFESVVEIAGPDHHVDRWFGQLPGSWSFDPPESAFWWQHGGHYLPDGHFITSTHDAERAEEILVREYELDEATRTLRQVFTLNEGAGMWGIEYNQMGEVARLPNGNTLHNLGTYPRIREGAPDGTIVWDLEFDVDNDLGRTTPVRDLYALVAPRR